MTISFAVNRACPPLTGKLLYRLRDHALDFEALSPKHAASCVGPSGQTSVAVGTVQLEVSVDSGRVLYPWGYLPRESLRVSKLQRLNGEAGCLFVGNGARLISGITDVVADSLTVSMLRDGSGTLLQITVLPGPTDTVIEFAQGCTVGLQGGALSVLQFATELSL